MIKFIIKIIPNVISNTKRVGLKKLIEVTETKASYLDSWHVAFLLAPRINSAGRLKDAGIAVKLLTTKNEEEASEIAKDLNKTNKESS